MTKQERQLVTGAAVVAGLVSLWWSFRKMSSIPVLPPSAIKWDTAK